MRVFSNILKLFKMIQKGEDRFFYDEPRTYAVSFSAEIRNNGNETRSCIVVFPMPAGSDWQNFVGDIIPLPEGNFRSEDVLYHNAYLWWRVQMPPKKTAVFQENFTISLRPHWIPLDTMAFTREDYSRLDRNQRELYLRNNRFINGSDPKIKKIAEEIIGDEQKISRIISNVNDYVIAHCSYGNPVKGLYSFSDALGKDKVDCGGFDTLLVSLLNSAGIPARIVSGFFAGYAENSMHAWAEALLPDGKWMPLDPSIEKLSHEEKTKKSGRIGFTGSDRVALSVGCDIPLAIEREEINVDILQNPMFFAEGHEKDFSIRTAFITSMASA